MFAALAMTVVLSACGGAGASGTPETDAQAANPNPPANAVSPIPLSRDGADAVRGTGKLRAAREFIVQAPRLQRRSNRLTLVSLIPNGSRVEQGALLA
ncbi:MAG: hypothetical protein U5J83_14810 [Bryobacterales bacterium]|nr:hypothetical protein [Bryobacterales bacterium]